MSITTVAEGEPALEATPLRLEFQKNGYQYRQAPRILDVALYRVYLKSKGDRASARLVAIEVVPITSRVADRYHSCPYEHFPSDEEFSRRGEQSFIIFPDRWFASTRRAVAYFQKIVLQQQI